jgi:hypothetical protein
MNLYPRFPTIEPEYISDEQYREIVSSDPDVREAIDIAAAGAVRSGSPVLRGRTEYLAMVDDIPPQIDSSGSGMSTRLASPRRIIGRGDRIYGWDLPRMSYELDKAKATKCLEIAEFLLENVETDKLNLIETAIDLMPLPIMNIERIHKRLGLGNNKTAEPPKLLNRFEILKKEE